MKFSARIISLVLAVMLICSTISISAFAAENETMYGIGFVTASALRLRSEPNLYSETLDYASKNECVVVVSKEGDWYKVIYNLQEGYMHQDYVSVLTKENAELGYGTVTGSAVNMRSGPSTSHSVVAVASKGDKAYIIGLNEGWYKVIYGTNICYIRSDYLKLTEVPYENQDSSISPRFFLQGKSTGVIPSAAALNGILSSGSNISSGSSLSGSTSSSANSGSNDYDISSWVSGWYDIISSASGNSSNSGSTSASGSTSTSGSTSNTTTNSGYTGLLIVAEANKHLGIPYVLGGTDPSTGFDCSGFVYYVMKQVGYSMYRTPAAQYTQGTYVAKEDLQPGDIVFFAGTSSYSSGISHVGIYVGGGQFIHSPNSSSVVSYATLSSSYWTNHYYGARRIA